MPPVNVSIVMPAYNAAATLGEALTSVCRQTHSGWELIVVDDGSTDGTAELARSFAAREPRIRVISQPNAGESGARNTGIAQARFDWLLFLDADDWIAPAHLDRMARAIAADPGLDAVHCRSVRVAGDGVEVADAWAPPTGDLFPILARRAAFPIHACIVRRSIVDDVGRFDTTLRKSADWDLWQRIARTGARFGAVPEVLAYYRMQPSSASLDAPQMLEDGLRVLARGHAADPRVSSPHPDHAGGAPPDQMRDQPFYLLSWCAGLLIGQGQDAVRLIDAVGDVPCPDLNTTAIAQCVFDAGTLPSCQSLEAWEALWPAARQPAARFLDALEARSQTPNLGSEALTALTRMVLRHSPTYGASFRDAEAAAAAEIAGLRARAHLVEQQVAELSAAHQREADLARQLTQQAADAATREQEARQREADLARRLEQDAIAAAARDQDGRQRAAELEARNEALRVELDEIRETLRTSEARLTHLERQLWVRIGRRVGAVNRGDDGSSAAD